MNRRERGVGALLAVPIVCCVGFTLLVVLGAGAALAWAGALGLGVVALALVLVLVVARRRA